MNPSFIEVKRVTKVFGRFSALREVSLDVTEGEVVGILGPNGSGKSTLMRLLCAYFPPTHGSVRIAGYDTRYARLEVRRRVGYAIEGVVLYPELTVADFLKFVAAVKRVSGPILRDTVARFGLERWLDRRIASLSKGYRQRVVLAQALLGDPPVLILDEPTVGLDPETAVQVRDWISQATDRTVVLSTHSIAEANLLCDRLVVMHEGRVLTEGSPRQLFPEQVTATTLEEEFLRLMATVQKAALPGAGAGCGEKTSDAGSLLEGHEPQVRGDGRQR